MQRRGLGPARAAHWWAVLLAHDCGGMLADAMPCAPVHLELGHAARMLARRGYGVVS